MSEWVGEWVGERGVRLLVVQGYTYADEVPAVGYRRWAIPHQPGKFWIKAFPSLK